MKKFKLFSLLVLMTLLASCGSDGAAGGGGIIVLSESGEKIDVTGEWISSCYIFSSEDWKDVYIFSGASLSVYFQIYTSTNGTCSSSYTRYQAAYSASSDVPELPTNVIGEKTLTGWSNDGFDTPTTAPNSQAGPALPDKPTVSTLDAKWAYSDISGDMRYVLYIDDTVSVSQMVLYSSNLLWNVNAVYPDYLRADKVFIKQ